MDKDKVIKMKSHDKFRGYTFSAENYDIINGSKEEMAATTEHEGGHFMEPHLFDEIKKDLREREERTRKEINDREHRFEKSIENYTQEAKERELRYREDLKKQEERFYNDSQEREARFNHIAERIENNTNDSLRHIENMKTQNLWGNIALFIGMLAIVVTLIIVVV